jgi:AcrR family transcriptional regulator
MDAVRTHGAEVSIDELAAGAGVSKPVLYDEFGDKLGVADAIAVVLADGLVDTVVRELGRARQVDITMAVDVVVRALIDLIEAEPELYSFLVRSFRMNDRGFLDNALVRVIHERAKIVFGLAAPGVDPDRMAVLTDGVFGFVMAAVESWRSTRRPPKDDLVQTLALVIEQGLRAIAADPRAKGQGAG